jgi:hypothetical protein
VKLALCTLTLALQVGYTAQHVPKTLTVKPKGCPAVHVKFEVRAPGRLRICPIRRRA